MLVGVIDIGLGNVNAVKRMVQKVGGEPVSISNPGQLSSVTKFILPGVGNFNEGMRRLKLANLDDAIRTAALQHGTYVLGICLGMQLMCRSSEEGEVNGLSIVDADVVKIVSNVAEKIKVPHMGWNTVDVPRENALMERNNEESRFYFVHSYKVIPDNDEVIIAKTNYGGQFCSAFQQDNIFGVQFHPEKSHRFGLKLINNFVRL